jgi:glutathione synthase/RimK-type ligase-like ATP-grasp enzyme
MTSGTPLPGTGTARLLLVIGSDRGLQANARGRYHLEGGSDVFKLIPASVKFEKLNLHHRALRSNLRPDLSRFDCVVNLVTDPDQQPRTLDALAKLLRHYRGRVINRPEAVLRSTRDLVARKLGGVPGLRVPKAVRLRNPRPGAAAAAATRSALDFPLIVRLAGSHTGRIVGLVDSLDGLEAACSGGGEFILTEFIDTRSDDGLFRKYRIWGFGARSIFRHVAIADDWNVHVGDGNRFMFDRPALIDEEVRLMATPEGAFPDEVHRVFAAVRDRLGLDFFGLDFGFDADGRMVLFEANATMNFFPLVVDPRFAFRQKLHAPAEDAFLAMLGLPPSA